MKLLLVDADNTLWHVEELYDRARERLCELLNGHGIDSAEAKTFQLRTDKDLYSTMRYSRHRYAQSFVATLANFLPALAKQLEPEVRGFAMEALNTKARLTNGAFDGMRLLSGCFRTVIYSAGDKEIQTRRIEESGLLQFAHSVEIVEEKTVQELVRLVSLYSADASNTWVVGDSRKSDIDPAVVAGCNAIWIGNHNWTDVESVQEPVHPNVHIAENFTAATNILLQQGDHK